MVFIIGGILIGGGGPPGSPGYTYATVQVGKLGRQKQIKQRK